jgi:hypothetical protein
MPGPATFQPDEPTPHQQYRKRTEQPERAVSVFRGPADVQGLSQLLRGDQL